MYQERVAAVDHPCLMPHKSPVLNGSNPEQILVRLRCMRARQVNTIYTVTLRARHTRWGKTAGVTMLRPPSR